MTKNFNQLPVTIFLSNGMFIYWFKLRYYNNGGIKTMEINNTFFATVRKTVPGTYEITIPIKNIKFEGWEEGDELKVFAVKITPPKKEDVKNG